MFTRFKEFLSDANFHWRDTAYIFVIGVVLMSLIQMYQQWVRDTAPPDEYMTVGQIGIPDFFEGENPLISYDRTIHKTFSATWTAEIQRAGTNAAMCISTHTSNYSPDKKLPEGGPTLNWFMFREPLPDCTVKGGNYRVYVCWTIDRLDAIDVRMCKTSNVFTVYPKELRKKLLDNP